MNPQNNKQPLSEELKLKTKELFPDDAERILEYFATKFEFHFNDYKSLKGFTPSENLIKVLFICCLRTRNLKLENCYFLSSLPFCLKHFYNGALSDRAEYEIFPLISPLEYIGSDGGGGSFFMDMSNNDDTFYHVWEEFDGLEKMESSMMDVIRLINAEALYQEVKTQFNHLLTKHYCSYTSILEESDLKNLIHLSVGIGLSNSPYMPATTFDYSYDYFVTYFQDEESDYFKYDNIVNSINSQIMATLYQLYFSNHKEELKKLIQLVLRKAKGRIIMSHLHFFNGLLTAEVELKNRIIVNIQD